ncbi:ABC-type polysaccharide/polyol phosphate transport system, ATPase component [Leptolyngbya sp. PCC 7375]|nr:ABC-type polysaccharide/polyol phosphate transport system, ATPase component [Leptolyngbya sp. PCC 7375]
MTRTLDTTAVSLRNVSKLYKKYKYPVDRLKQFLFPKRKYGKEFWALKDIELTIPKGKATGIIGRNGAGKSTLLQLIAGTLSPTTGEVSVNGRVAALLELGSGFNLEFTGRENIFLSGKLLGLTTSQIHGKLDAIIDFSEIGDFLDQPVKTYSSGMKLRLAFSVYVAVDPDILIIDEALSVGDIFFQQKCFQRMEDLLSKNKTILFVSHNLSLVKNFCKTAYLLDKGEIVFYGSSSEAIGKFYRIKNEHQTVAIKNKNYVSSSIEKIDNSIPCKNNVNSLIKKVAELTQDSIWKLANFNIIDSKAEILAVSILDQHLVPTTICQIGDVLRFRAYFFAGNLDDFYVGITLKNKYDRFVFRGGSYFDNQPPLNTSNENIQCFEIELKLNIEAGSYTIMFSLEQSKLIPNETHKVCTSPWIGPLEVCWDYRVQKAPFLGMVGLPYKGRALSLGAIDG